MREKDCQVVISGAGPAGAILGLLLARAGVETKLIERHEDFSREFRGELVWPSGLKPLKQIGIWEDFEKVGQVRIDQVKMFINEKPFVSPQMDSSVIGEFRPRWISQPHFLEMLVEKASAFANFELLRSTRVRNLVRDENSVTGVVTDAHGEISADLVVGADGRSSIVRARSGLSAKADKLPMDIVWIKVPADRIEIRNTMRMYVGRGRLVIMAPTFDGFVQLGFIIRKGSFKELRQLGTEGLIEEISNYVDAPTREVLKTTDADDLRPFLLSTVADRVDSWCLPGLLLIGDAAHTMSPVGGQGVNIAIRDAVLAANYLIPALKTANNADTLYQTLQKIETERLEEVKLIQAQQAKGPRILLNQSLWMRPIFLLAQKLGRGAKFDAASDPSIKNMIFGVSPIRWTVE